MKQLCLFGGQHELDRKRPVDDIPLELHETQGFGAEEAYFPFGRPPIFSYRTT